MNIVALYLIQKYMLIGSEYAQFVKTIIGPCKLRNLNYTDDSDMTGHVGRLI